MMYFMASFEEIVDDVTYANENQLIAGIFVGITEIFHVIPPNA